MAVSISRKENKLAVKFDYAVDRIAKIKSFMDYYCDAASKVWILSCSGDNVKNPEKLFSNEACAVSLVIIQELIVYINPWLIN